MTWNAIFPKRVIRKLVMGKILLQQIRIDNLCEKDAFEEAGSFSVGKTSKMVGYVNAQSVNTARKDPEYLEIINRFDFLKPDGIGISLAMTARGEKRLERLDATDFNTQILEQWAKEGKTLFLLGGKEGVAEKVKARLEAKGAVVVGALSGYDLNVKDEEICRRINDLHPDVLVVALGTPFQEKWVFQHKERLKAKIFLTVGGLFDFLANVYPRAPQWVRWIGMEWFFRMSCDPQRLWRRYILGNPEFLFHALVEALKERFKRKENA